MHERFIAVSSASGFSGHWGSGNTEMGALENLRQQKPSPAPIVMWRFFGDLPFAPADREAEDNEADCWAGSHSLFSLRCQRERVSG